MNVESFFMPIILLILSLSRMITSSNNLKIFYTFFHVETILKMNMRCIISLVFLF